MRENFATNAGFVHTDMLFEGCEQSVLVSVLPMSYPSSQRHSHVDTWLNWDGSISGDQDTSIEAQPYTTTFKIRETSEHVMFVCR